MCLTRMQHKALWTCPKCGHRFVTRNIWHSCNRYRLSDHFKGKDPLVRELFDRFVQVMRELGPVHMYAQKTGIVFQVRVRFVGVKTLKHWLEAAMWLKRRVELPRFHRIEALNPPDHIHYFRLKQASDLDAELMALLREAYSVGCQEHLKRQ